MDLINFLLPYSARVLHSLKYLFAQGAENKGCINLGIYWANNNWYNCLILLLDTESGILMLGLERNKPSTTFYQEFSHGR